MMKAQIDKVEKEMRIPKIIPFMGNKDTKAFINTFRIWAKNKLCKLPKTH